MAPGKRPRPPIIPKQLEDNVNAAHKMTKNDIQRLSTDQLSQGQEAQKRTRSGRIIGTSPIKEANRTPPNVQVDVAHTSLNRNSTTRKMTDNDSKRGGIDRQLQGVGNLENTTTNATLQANGTHSRHQNNSTLRRMPCSDSQRVDTFLPMQDIENGDDTPIPLQHCKIVGHQEMLTKTQLDTIAPAIMDTSETPFDPNNNTSTMDADSTTGRRKVRGDSRGVGTDKLIQANGSRPLGGVEIKPENNAPTGVNSSRMKSEIGTIVRNYAPLDVEKWADISESDKVFMMEKLQEKFIIDFTQDHVKKAIEGKMAARYRDHRNKCHKHFKKYPTIALAKQNPYKHVSDQKQWDWLCDRFASEKFQARHTGQAPGQIELFKLMHWTSQNGWINQEAEASYEKMLELQKQPVPEGGQALKEAEICVQVLGSRSGYIKGLGHGPRPPSSSSKSTHKSHREIELENELKATRELLQSQETRIQHQQSQIAQLASFVSEMRQHMHIPGSSSRSSSPSDDTPLMDS
ncbi:hypothetical protein CK203_048835 [Vitis vinifera]|uniref:Transposase, Ptta/En/Spm, plant n=1 Tax=Vitis vinifera TaxID=29760 RepID=A0A438G7G3_VITVI|nr:hypothetical protein CK203_065944 [Vitis vinifera]RVW67267.1 hypothetical protein CK203_065460 [Vitis vinifera]RVW68167.1 hypothetical protein CK203_065376 [Vitis vinifera]RVW75690.1 hypothetical protein CK203_048835 [Vitis vinifera]